MMSASTTRTETDSFGPIEVPADAYWGAQTQRSIENFPFGRASRCRSRSSTPRASSSRRRRGSNASDRRLDAELAEAIQQAAGEVASGDHDDQFPLVIWQTGSGTQSNMNANEVIAGRANEILTGQARRQEPGPSQRPCQQGPVVERQLPDGDARRRQRAPVHDRLLTGDAAHPPPARRSRRATGTRIVKIGRTHLQDATPLTLGQEFSGYCLQIEAGIKRVEAVAAACPQSSPRAAPRSAPG
jgi:fumarate hydratase class II